MRKWQRVEARSNELNCRPDAADAKRLTTAFPALIPPFTAFVANLRGNDHAG
jgi:hypothetical protein